MTNQTLELEPKKPELKDFIIGFSVFIQLFGLIVSYQQRYSFIETIRIMLILEVLILLLSGSVYLCMMLIRYPFSSYRFTDSHFVRYSKSNRPKEIISKKSISKIRIRTSEADSYGFSYLVYLMTIDVHERKTIQINLSSYTPSIADIKNYLQEYYSEILLEMA